MPIMSSLEQRVEATEREIEKLRGDVTALEARILSRVRGEIKDVERHINAAIVSAQVLVSEMVADRFEQLDQIAKDSHESARLAREEAERREDRALAMRKSDMELEEQATKILAQRADIVATRVDSHLKPELALHPSIDGSRKHRIAIWTVVATIFAALAALAGAAFNSRKP
jgi:hypothetical protein